MIRLILLSAFFPLFVSCKDVPLDKHPDKEPLVSKDSTVIIAPLIDPRKLDTLAGKRAANRRLRLICYHLETARLAGDDPAALISLAQSRLGVGTTARAKEVKASLLRSLDILSKLGCLNEAGIDKLKTGNAPTITKGPYSGDIASVDHIIPRSVCEELDEKLYNLEFMPSKLNSSKGSKIGPRQIALAKKWHGLGLLSEKGIREVQGKSALKNNEN